MNYEEQKRGLEAQMAKELIEQKELVKSKAGKIQKKNPYWLKEDCERLANKEYWIGMQYDQLKYLRGFPNHVNPSYYGDRVERQWYWDDYTPSCFYGKNHIITDYN